MCKKLTSAVIPRVLSEEDREEEKGDRLAAASTVRMFRGANSALWTRVSN